MYSFCLRAFIIVAFIVALFFTTHQTSFLYKHLYKKAYIFFSLLVQSLVDHEKVKSSIQLKIINQYTIIRCLFNISSFVSVVFCVSVFFSCFLSVLVFPCVFFLFTCVYSFVLITKQYSVYQLSFCPSGHYQVINYLHAFYIIDSSSCFL